MPPMDDGPHFIDMFCLIDASFCRAQIVDARFCRHVVASACKNKWCPYGWWTSFYRDVLCDRWLIFRSFDCGLCISMYFRWSYDVLKPFGCHLAVTDSRWWWPRRQNHQEACQPPRGLPKLCFVKSCAESIQPPWWDKTRGTWGNLAIICHNYKALAESNSTCKTHEIRISYI